MLIMSSCMIDDESVEALKMAPLIIHNIKKEQL